MKAYIAADFGGGSGRVIAGTFDAADEVTLHEVHRFANHQVDVDRHTYWDILSLFRELKCGLKKAVDQGFEIVSVGIDTWGVDFALIDDSGMMLSNPITYRDRGVAGAAERFFAKYPDARKLYSEAGIQIMDIDSLFRLCDLREQSPALFDAADKILFTPDLLSYFLTSEANNEYTIATTSCLIDARTRTWNEALIERTGLPRRLFGRIVMPGEIRGWVTDDILREIGATKPIAVVAVGSHDTASAVYTVKGTYDTDGTAYLSSGTWSLLGVTLSKPILTEEARLCGFTNEGGVVGIRFLQNITGLWILQQLMAQWKSQGLPTDYDYLLAGAEASTYQGMFDVDDPAFHSPKSMTEAIDSYVVAHGFESPASQADYVIATLRSLAERYKKGVEGLNSLLPQPVCRLQIIGGGSRNGLLNRLTAEATGLEVTAGPVEATAIGNILVQYQANPQQ